MKKSASFFYFKVKPFKGLKYKKKLRLSPLGHGDKPSFSISIQSKFRR
jgi:hypothetical protein